MQIVVARHRGYIKYKLNMGRILLGIPFKKCGHASAGRARKARDRGVLALYVAGSGARRVGMRRRSNAGVFMERVIVEGWWLF